MGRDAAETGRTHDWLSLARQHFFADRLEECRRVCQSIPPDSPNYADALHLHALVALRLGDQTHARALLDRALIEAPDNPSLHNSRGTLHFQCQDWPAAEIDFRKAIAADPKLREPHVNLGNALHAQGRPQEAEAAYRQALGLAPNDATILNNLGVALRDQARLDAALTCFRRALDLRPDDLEALFNQADVHLLQHRNTDAESGFRRVLDVASSFIPAGVGLAQSLLAQNKDSEAAAVLHQLQRIAEDHPAVETVTRNFFSKMIRPAQLRRMLDPNLGVQLDQIIRKYVTPVSRILAIGESVLPAALSAARAGAYAVAICEPQRSVVNLFERIAAANGLADRVTILTKPSTALQPRRDLSEPPDILLWVVVGSDLLSGKTLLQLRHARAELLAPNTRVIPAAIRVLAAPVETAASSSSPAYTGSTASSYSDLDLELLALAQVGPTAPIDFELHEPLRIGEWTEALYLDFAHISPAPFEQHIPLTVTESGCCMAVIVRYELLLDSHTAYASPDLPARSDWPPAYHPLKVPRAVTPGDQVNLCVRLDHTGVSFEV